MSKELDEARRVALQAADAFINVDLASNAAIDAFLAKLSETHVIVPLNLEPFDNKMLDHLGQELLSSDQYYYDARKRPTLSDLDKGAQSRYREGARLVVSAYIKAIAQPVRRL